MCQTKSRPDYKWVILAVCFFMEFLCLGFCSSNAGLYTAAVTNALNIDRAVYAVGNSIRYIVQVFVVLSFSTMINRFGIKKMVCAGLCCLIGAALLRATGTNVYYFYIAGVLHGTGMVFVGGTMASTIIRQWFHQDLGKYTGIVMSANGIGGAIAAQIVSPIINNGEVFGYRKAYLLAACIAFGIGIVIMIFLRDAPTDDPVVVKKEAKKARGPLWVGMDYALVKKKPYFYVTAVLIFLTGITLQSIGSITIVNLTDMGFPAAFIATTATLSSLTLAFSKFLSGAVYDKRGLRFSLLMCQLAALLMLMLNGMLSNSPLGMALSVAATLLSSFAMPLETVVIPLLTNDLFGTASYTKVLGVFTAMNTLGLCLGSPIGELVRNFFGNYRPCFWLFTVVLIIVIIGFQFVLKAAARDKKAILAEENS